MSSPDEELETPETQGDDEVINVRRGMFGVTGSGDTSGYGRLVREVTLPGSSPRPYGVYFDDVVDALADALGATSVNSTTRSRRSSCTATS